MIAGLTSGVISEWGKRVEGVGADILVQPPNASIFFAFLSVGMQESLGDKISALSGVDEVAPTVILTEPKNLVMIYGIDYQRFNALSKGFLFRDGRPFEGPDDVIADDIIAQTKHLKVGSQVTLLNHSFTVCGIVGHGKGGRNQELALALADPLAGTGLGESIDRDPSPLIVAASVGTDGIDGPTDAAGAIVDPTTADRARAAGLGTPSRYLDENNAYAFFLALGDLIHIGRTDTNVGDLQVILFG